MPSPLLTLRPLGDERLAWVLEHEGRLQSGESDLEHLPPLPEGTRVRLLIPGEQVTHATARIAAKSPRLIAQALPYALEEQLAEDIEQLRIAHGPRQKDGSVQARVVRRAWLEALLERLRRHGLAPQAAYSELDLLPAPTEGWVALSMGGIMLARGPQGEALALEPELLRPLLGDAPLRPIEAPRGPLTWLHQQMNAATPIDLLGGGRAPGLGERLRPWRIPALLAATALLLQGGLILHETHTLHAQRAAMQAEIERLAREAAPEVKRWVNPLAQLRQQAAAGAASPTGGGLLDLLARLAPALAARPEIKLGALRFQGGTLEAQLTAPQGSSLEALLAELRRQPRLSAELAEQRVESGQAIARLRLKELRP